MGTSLVCGFQRRFDVHYLKLLDTVVTKKAIGEIRTIHVVYVNPNFCFGLFCAVFSP